MGSSAGGDMMLGRQSRSLVFRLDSLGMPGQGEV